jgi:hypothetical protein
LDKIGLVNKFAVNFEQTWKSSQLISQLDPIKKHNDFLADSLKLLKVVHTTKDLSLALGVEEMFLREERNKYANSPEEIGSLDKAIEQLQEARKSHKIVQKPEIYQEATETYSGKRREAWLPLDSFRDFLKSHTTRLGNRMAGQISTPEKNILRQRKENMSMVRDVYISMQREALGMGKGHPLA